MSTLFLEALHGVHAVSTAPEALRFERALRHPEEAQRALLDRLLAVTATTARGRELGLRARMTLREFRRAVPIVRYDDLEPYVARVARGEANVLTTDPVTMLERSGGSTATTKLVPYNKGLFAAFSRATNPWLFDLQRRYPRTRRGRSYWSVSHAVRHAERTEGGLPIGLEDDSAYLGAVGRYVVGKLFAVPPAVAKLPTFEAWQEATLLALLEADDLALVSVWSPTFFTVLLEALEKRWGELARKLSARRRAVLGSRFEPARVWPALALVSSWADGSARAYVGALREAFPRVPLQPKGLLATEGVVSVPYGAECERGAVLAVRSHVLEFLEVHEDETLGTEPLEPEDLEEGKRYSPVFSAENGFLRYHLRDVVRCTGRLHRTPLVRFEGKLDRTSDLCGEKVTEAQAVHALAHARATTGVEPKLAMLLPVPTPQPHYVLLSEGAIDRGAAFVAAVEAYLATGHHYAYARGLGQLGPIRLVTAEKIWERYAAAAAREGRKAGDLKPTALEPKAFAREAFPEVNA
jgi:hypothetical protein